MPRAKRIGANLLNEELWDLINASTKIFPITYEDVLYNRNPHNYEFGRISSGEYKNNVYYWNKTEYKWEIIGADDLEVYWDEIRNKPGAFNPIAHGHESSDIVGLDETLDDIIQQLFQDFVLWEELNVELDTKVDKEEGKGLSQEDFTSELKMYLLSLTENAGVDYEYMAQLLQSHMDDNDRHLTSAMKALIDTIPEKAAKSTLQGHMDNSSVHVTQIDKNKFHEHPNKEILDKFTEEDGTLLYDSKPIEGSGGAPNLTLTTLQLGNFKLVYNEYHNSLDIEVIQ